MVNLVLLMRDVAKSFQTKLFCKSIVLISPQIRNFPYFGGQKFSEFFFLNSSMFYGLLRDGRSGEAGWEHTHPDFGRIEGAAGSGGALHY